MRSEAEGLSRPLFAVSEPPYRLGKRESPENVTSRYVIFFSDLAKNICQNIAIRHLRRCK